MNVEPRPYFSIVIPARNEGGYIGPTLAQFLPYFDSHSIEVIVSDGNSTDGTVQIVREMEEKTGGRIRLVQACGKQNIAIGRNFGAANAQGEILINMDADVRLQDSERFFTTIRHCFETSPKVVAATAPLWIYPEEAKFWDRFFHTLANQTIRFSFHFGLYLAKGECQIVRNSAFKQVNGYHEDLVAGEDCNLFYRLGQIGRIVYLRRLRIFHSPRRFRAYGYGKTAWVYFREGVSLALRGKSWVEEWEPVR